MFNSKNILIRPVGWARAHRNDFILAMFLALAGWKFTYGLELRTDIIFSDPSYYIGTALNLEQDGLPDASHAPIYVTWLNLLSRSTSDSEKLYDRDYKLLTMALPLVFFLCLRVWRVPSHVALIAAGLALISHFNYESFSRVYHAATIVMLVSLVGATIVPRATTGLLIAALGSLFASYMRPELFVAVLGYLALYGVMSLLSISEFKYIWKCNLAIGVIGAALFLWLGCPLAGGRSILAFSEHYALNISESTGGGGSSWFRAQDIFQADFGSSASISEAAEANPRQFCWHLWRNFRRLPGVFVSHCSLHSDPYITGELVVGVAFVLWILVGNGIREIFRQIFYRRRLVVCTLIPLLVSALSVIIIYPRRHYLVLPATLLFALVFVLAVPSRRQERARSPVILGILVLALTSHLPSASQLPVNRAIVHFLQEAKIGSNAKILTIHKGLDVYLPPGVQILTPAQLSMPLRCALETGEISAVIVDDKWLSYSHSVQNPDLIDFQSLETLPGVKMHALPGTTTRIYCISNKAEQDVVPQISF